MNLKMDNKIPNLNPGFGLGDWLIYPLSEIILHNDHSQQTHEGIGDNVGPFQGLRADFAAACLAVRPSGLRRSARLAFAQSFDGIP